MQDFLLHNLWIIIPFLVWTLAWKGAALWKAARNGHKAWFVILLLVNSLAILEIIYIYYFAKPSTDNKQLVNSL